MIEVTKRSESHGDETSLVANTRSSQDKRTRKAGNKLLRHSLAGLTGTYLRSAVGSPR